MKLSALLVPDLKHKNKTKHPFLLSPCICVFIVYHSAWNKRMCWNCTSSLWWKITVRLFMLESKGKGFKKSKVVWRKVTCASLPLPPPVELSHHVLQAPPSTQLYTGVWQDSLRFPDRNIFGNTPDESL